MKRLILWLMFAGVFRAEAQISMTLQVPPSGVLLKNQLWNMVLVNTGNVSSLLRVNMVLMDEKTGQPVLTGTSMPFELPRGAKQMQAKDLGPIQYVYNSPAFMADQDPNGFLPAGSYQACYTVVGVQKSSVPRAENCILVNVDPLSPPLLNTPADESGLYTSYPQFTWLPPTPAKLFNDLSYTLIVTEVLPGQGKADAVEQNIPVYSAGFVRNLYQNFPSSYRSLDTGKLYAWRIVAMNNGRPVSMSDVWTFKVIKPLKPTLIVNEAPFVDLKRGMDPSIASLDGSLRLTYENVAADSAVSYTITSIEDAANPVVQKGLMPLTRGRNFIELSLERSAGYAKSRVYLFSMTNGRNETWTVKFTLSSLPRKRSNRK